MRELLTSTGRATRATFWKFYGVFYGLIFLMGFFTSDKEPPDGLTIVLGLILFPLMLVGIIVQIKRWHDRDKSGWWVLINFIPCIGHIWTLVECGFLPGTPGDNRFGPDPRNK
jgi:uncharacterized membrane protein YhaH (DUF805 family)